MIAASALLAAVPVFPTGATVSVTTGTSVIYGMARELDYAPGYLQSELDWALEPVFLFGTALEVRTPMGFLASVEARAGIPAKSGYITDSDFLNGDGKKTNFSQHDCYSERAVLVDAKVGWRFPLLGWISLEPFAALGLMSFKWSARAGYLQYPVQTTFPPPYPYWSASDPKTPVYGTGIIYAQDYLIPSAGVSIGFHFLDRFDASLSFALTPFVFCNDTDNHLMRLIDFTENMQGGLLLEPGLSLDFTVTENARLSLDASFRHITGLLGDSWEMGTGQQGSTGQELDPGAVAGPFANSGGAALDALSVALGFTVAL